MTAGCAIRALHRVQGDNTLVFSALQNPRHIAVADQFPDRHRSRWRGPAGHAIGVARTQAPDRFRDIVRDLRIFAARIPRALSAGAAVSAMGCRGRRAGRNRRARRIARRRSFGRARRRRRQRRRRPHRRFRCPGPSLSRGAHHLHRRKREFDVERCQGSRLRGIAVRKSRYLQGAPDHGTALAQHPGERRILPGAGRAQERASDGCW